LALAVVGVLLMTLTAGQAQLSKGYQMLLNRGVQLQGLVQWDDYFQPDTHSNANHSLINWGWTSRPSLMDAMGGFPWSRWVSGATNMPLQPGEGPYLNQLVALQLGDEWDLNTQSIRDRLMAWFNSVQTNRPNAILFHNNWAGQIRDQYLQDFIDRAGPGMLCFDGYPWQSDYSSGTPIGGPPISGLTQACPMFVPTASHLHPISNA
jgi:hypothetical protein